MLELIGILVVFGVVMVGNIVFDAWVIHTLYGWFVITSFAAPALTIAQVAGILLVFRGMRGYKLTKDDPEDKKKTGGEKLLKVFGGLAQNFLIALMSLGIGWCIKAFLP